MKVLFVASEAAPFIKTGGLGDVAGALPKQLVKEGADVRVILPLYQDIPAEYKDTMTYLGNVYVPVSWRRQYCGVFSSAVDGVTYYFVDNEYYFKRVGLYGYYDDAERFAFFSRAVLESLKIIGFYPDVLHLNDWQTALVPVYLDTFYRGEHKYEHIRTVFTIHNIEFQGKYGMEILGDVVGIPNEKESLIDYSGCVNFMKGAIESSNIVTTVSNTYSEEILDSYYAYGLEDILRERKFKLKGILNGIDTESYDPKTDKALFVNFDKVSTSGKEECKQALCKMLDMPYAKDRPMIAMIGRLTNQKGIDLVFNVIEEILNRDVQVVVLGTGDWVYETGFKEIEKRYPTKFRALITFSNDLARKIYGASDMFLMPSRFEPCGLSQLIAMRYGSVPIVRETGGLRDTVLPYIYESGEGTGFTFYSYNSYDMLSAIDRAVECYHKSTDWRKVRRNAMKADNSWAVSATKYMELYKSL